MFASLCFQVSQVGTLHPIIKSAHVSHSLAICMIAQCASPSARSKLYGFPLICMCQNELRTWAKHSSTQLAPHNVLVTWTCILQLEQSMCSTWRVWALKGHTLVLSIKNIYSSGYINEKNHRKDEFFTYGTFEFVFILTQQVGNIIFICVLRAVRSCVWTDTREWDSAINTTTCSSFTEVSLGIFHLCTYQ